MFGGVHSSFQKCNDLWRRRVHDIQVACCPQVHGSLCWLPRSETSWSFLTKHEQGFMRGKWQKHKWICWTLQTSIFWFCNKRLRHGWGNTYDMPGNDKWAEAVSKLCQLRETILVRLVRLQAYRNCVEIQSLIFWHLIRTWVADDSDKHIYGLGHGVSVCSVVQSVSQQPFLQRVRSEEQLQKG